MDSGTSISRRGLIVMIYKNSSGQCIVDVVSAV